MRLSAFAPAKVNLFLHVGRAGEDGYHPVCSLMAFADLGDTVAVQPSDFTDFEITGEFAEGLIPNAENLMVRAALALREQAPGPVPPFRLILDKRLPVASGLGGGSADAGATLRLLAEALEMPLQDEALEAVAASLGSDGAACFRGAPVIAQGRGERLSAAPELGVLDAVLVNPRVASPTAEVYRAFDAAGGTGEADLPPLPDRFEGAEDVAAMLSLTRNDLEAPAISLVPAIGEVLDTLRDEPEVLFARMSGSGATCFALCAGDIEAEGLAERLEAMRPDWWVRRCRLGGPW